MNLLNLQIPTLSPNNPKAYFTPLSLGDDLVAWYTPGDESTITLLNQTAFQSVSQETDSSGDGRTINQATSTQQPRYQRGVNNIATYPNEIGSPQYTLIESSVVANSKIAPDGTLTMDKLVESTANNRHDYFRAQPESLVAGTQYTYSHYASPAGRDWIKLRLDESGLFKGVYFNIANGTVGTADSGYTGAIAPVPGYPDIYRCSVTFTASTSAAHFAAPRLASANGTDVYTGDGVSGAYLWGRMINEGAIPNTMINRRSLSFDGVDDRLVSSSFVIPQPFWRIGVVTKRRQNITGQGFIATSSNSSASFDSRFFVSTNTNLAMFAGGSIVSIEGFTRDNPAVVGAYYNGSNSHVALNGSTVSGNAGTNGMDGITLGTSATGGVPGQFDIYEMVIGKGVLSDFRRQQIEGYLANKYGLTSSLVSGHPYKSYPPR